MHKWQKIGFLDGVTNKEGMASCLDAQVQFNEAIGNKTFCRLSIPTLRRILGNSQAFNRNQFTGESGGDSKLLLFKTKFAPTINEVDYCAVLAEDLKKEFDALFADFIDKNIVFRGFGHLSDGTMFMFYSHD